MLGLVEGFRASPVIAAGLSPVVLALMVWSLRSPRFLLPWGASLAVLPLAAASWPLVALAGLGVFAMAVDELAQPYVGHAPLGEAEVQTASNAPGTDARTLPASPRWNLPQPSAFAVRRVTRWWPGALVGASLLGFAWLRGGEAEGGSLLPSLLGVIGAPAVALGVGLLHLRAASSAAADPFVVLRARARGAAFLLPLGVLVALQGIALHPSEAQPEGRVRILVLAMVAGGLLAHASVSVPVRLLPRALRVSAVMATLGLPAVWGFAALVDGLAGDVLPYISIAFCAYFLAVGAFTQRLARRLLPLHGTWFLALKAATAKTTEVDVDDAIRAVLTTLRAPFQPTLRSPAVWVLEPPRIITIDAAGYLHPRERTMPPLLMERVLMQPFGTLTAELIEELEVRHSDYRALGAWFREFGVHAATAIAHKGQVEGLLLTPRLERAPLSLEELMATEVLASRLAAAVLAHGHRARALLRESELAHRLERAADVAAQVEEHARTSVRRHQGVTQFLGGSDVALARSAKAQAARDALEKRLTIGAPTVLLCPAGLDPVPHLARAWLVAGQSRPFMPVECTHSAFADPALWADPATSPLALCEGGVLALVDVHALPHVVQDLVARVHAEKRPPWPSADPFDFQIVVTLRRHRDHNDKPSAPSVSSGLAARLESAIEEGVVWPRLTERSEDLFTLLVDKLAREGLRTRGAPMGIHPTAFAELVEYPFEGDEAELDAIVVRLCARASGEVVLAEDVRALGIATSKASVLRLVQ
jgi:hypothetical protein